MRLDRPAAVAVAGMLLGVTTAWGASEVIALKDGHEVTGEVVAEKPGALYVDLGFDIVRIPRDQVLHRGKPGASAPSGSASAPGRGFEADPTGFYHSEPLRAAPVKELVAKYGEAVISIETPSG